MERAGTMQGIGGKKRLLAGLLGVLVAGPIWAADPGTAFTFQGRLVKDGTPKTDTCLLTCDLFDARIGGNRVGASPIGPLSVHVTDGLFTVNLDFGAGAINGQARWLEITVQCPGDVGATILTPRQELKPAPHALALPGLYTQQNATSPNVIAGLHDNSVTPGVVGATIAGGGVAGPDVNRVTDNFGTVGGGCTNVAGDGAGLVSDQPWATVGGGQNNWARAFVSTVAGGGDNTASAPATTVGGGQNNTASDLYATVGGGVGNTATLTSSTVGGGNGNSAGGVSSTVAGGRDNTAGGAYSTVGGGFQNMANGASSATIAGGNTNRADGAYSTVPGGEANEAGGSHSFAGGRRAKVRDAAQSSDGDGDEGTFVWADATNADFTSTGPNQFLIRAAGGVGINTTAPSSQFSVAGNADFSGRVGIGTNAPAQELDVAGDIHASGSISSGSSIRIDGNAHSILSDASLELVAPGGIGIGTSTPTAALHIAGTPGVDGIRFPDGTLQTTATVGGGTGDGHSLDAEDGQPVDALFVDAEGNVGIGTISPAGVLDVNGAARMTTLEIHGGSPIGQPLVGWGDNSSGQINMPPGSFSVISTGHNHSVGIRADGTLIAWGSNQFGQTNIPAGTFSAASAGSSFSLGIRTDGTLVGWGLNDSGQTIVPIGVFSQVSAGGSHGLAIRSDGNLVAWGNNAYSQTNVPSGQFSAISAGALHNLAIRTDGTLAGWGNNQYGQTNVPPGTFVAVAAGLYFSLAIRSDGTLVGWGLNSAGQTNVPSGTFVAVTAGGAISLPVIEGFGIAIRSDGTLVGWGDNSHGQINVPAGSFVAVDAGDSHVAGIAADPTPDIALRLNVDSAMKPGSDRWTVFSDQRLKTDIQPMHGALEKLLALHGRTFRWRDPGSQGGRFGIEMGLIADDVQDVFPQWVGRAPNGYKTITVSGFEALTTEALRDLRAEKDAEIGDLRKQKDQEIAELRERLNRLQSLVEALAAQREGGRP